MSAPDVESLLQAASRSRLGPLAVSYAVAGRDTWTLAITWSRRAPVDVRALYDEPTQTLRLERQVQTSLSAAQIDRLVSPRPWILEAAPTAGGGFAARLWLAAEGLTLNSLLAAVAELARLEMFLGQETAPITGEPKPDTAPAPTPGPQALPSWQSLPVTAELEGGNLLPEQGTLAQPGEASASENATLEQPDAASASPPPAGFCRECGMPHLQEHAFCTNCGAQLN